MIIQSQCFWHFLKLYNMLRVSYLFYVWVTTNISPKIHLKWDELMMNSFLDKSVINVFWWKHQTMFYKRMICGYIVNTQCWLLFFQGAPFVCLYIPKRSGHWKRSKKQILKIEIPHIGNFINITTHKKLYQ